tara:strand:+ start:143 stop:946 length:804 start_codon:yes stop_codon:yes gene_type:complete
MSIVHVAFYPSDWLAGTRGLTDAETGVYITLISRMYEMAAPIERDDDRLSRLCGCKSKASFVKSLKHLLSEGKIIEVDGALFNERVQKEIKNTTEKSSKAKTAAQSRWDRKPNKNNDTPHANASPKHMPQPCQSEPEPYNPSFHSGLTPKTENRFDEFWTVFADKRGKQAALKVWKKKKLDAIADQVISGAKIYLQTRGADQTFWKQAQGWLNDERWTDEVTQTQNTIDQFGNPSKVIGFLPSGNQKRMSDVEVMIARGNALRERGL